MDFEIGNFRNLQTSVTSALDRVIWHTLSLIDLYILNFVEIGKTFCGQTDGWIVQCFTSLPTQYRLYGRWFLQVKRPNQQYQRTERKPTKEKSENENNKIHI